MSRRPPAFYCPDCESFPSMYVGRVIAKQCSACESARLSARTGADRLPPKPLSDVLADAIDRSITAPSTVRLKPGEIGEWLRTINLN